MYSSIVFGVVVFSSMFFPCLNFRIAKFLRLIYLQFYVLTVAVNGGEADMDSFQDQGFVEAYKILEMPHHSRRPILCFDNQHLLYKFRT